MKRLVSLAVVVAFFVAIPQCLGQSQDAEKDASQLLTEQQLVRMFNLAMAPPPSCHQTVCNPAVKMFLDEQECGSGKEGKVCRAAAKVLAKECRLECDIDCHDDDNCTNNGGECTDPAMGADGFFQCKQ